MHTFEHEQRLIFFENGPNNNEPSKTTPEAGAQPDATIDQQQRAADAAQRNRAEKADRERDLALISRVISIVEHPDDVQLNEQLYEAAQSNDDDILEKAAATRMQAEANQLAEEIVSKNITNIEEYATNKIRNSEFINHYNDSVPGPLTERQKKANELLIIMGFVSEVRSAVDKIRNNTPTGDNKEILQNTNSAVVTNIQTLRTTPDYVAKIQAVAEAIRTGTETDNNVFTRIANEVKAQYPQITETLEQLMTAIQEDINTEVRNKTPNGLEKTLIMIGINQETAHQMREHITKKEWGKVLQKGLEIFQTVMSTVGDTLAQTFSGFGPDVLQFLPQKIRQMAGGNRMEFYRGINTLTENNIAVIDENTREPVKRPNSTKILNEYARFHGPKQNMQTPFVSIEKFMSTLTEQILTKKDSEIQKNATTGVYEITEAQLLNIAKSLQVTPDVTPPPPAPSAAPNAAPVAPATTPAAPISTPATPTGTPAPAPTTPATTPSVTPPTTA